MVMIALDTCFDGCSAALFGADGETLLARRFESMSRGHAERLPMMVDELFREAGVKPSALTRVAVTRGPGTFTGIRIGLSYAKGLGLALSIPVIGIDSLTAIAVPHRGETIVVAHKAGGTGLNYAAKFYGEPRAILHGPALIGDATLEDWSVGVNVIKDQSPDAATFGAYALALPTPDQSPQPLYLRQADAKPSAPAAFSTIVARAASVADAPVMAKMHGESFDHPWTEEMIVSSLALPGAGAFIVELANSTYGFVQYQGVAGEAEINTLCVLPIYRRQGFGQALMQALIAHLRQHNTTRLFLEVAADNEAAISLYRRHGFSETGLRKGYYARKSGAVDAITMTLGL
jgi:tRNA threonylcarbamoyl adenosine modification protein YeaZ/ribosomal-protein-alanine acetyltransferase